MAESEQGFFGRWSRRKQDLREGRPLQEPPAPEAEARPAPAPAAVAPAAPEGAAPAPVPPPPTLQDVAGLTPQSDYTRFMRSDVDPEVKNAAMKKLFADPHFNVMDGLDIYIDDYNKPDPLPPSMLRKLASAQFLNLFDDEKKASPAATAGAGTTASISSADLAPAPEAEPPAPIAHDHDDTDLRLQQDHAAGPQGSGGGPQ
jgi:hypothetical protein